MTTICSSALAIRTVMVYSGHRTSPTLGPYAESVAKRIEMFGDLNRYREEIGKKKWEVRSVDGEELIDVLSNLEARETLLVIPAGQSSRLEKVFTVTQTRFLQDEFFEKGGRAYFTCGSSYWVSHTRIYREVCLDHPESPVTLIKQSTLPLFQGVSMGPLCPFPGVKYQVGFYSDAVEVTDGETACTIYLSGGGSLIPDPPEKSGQKVRVLARYPHEELRRLGVREEDRERLENAAIMVSVGSGAAILSMYHPYYSFSDSDVERYEAAFPDCGTNWREVHRRLSDVDARMRFVLHSMLTHLEEMRF
jgi:glutamine amidotransferase-like uncharacterized protein